MKLAQFLREVENAAKDQDGGMRVLMEVPGDEHEVREVRVIRCQHEGQTPYFFITAEGCEE